MKTLRKANLQRTNLFAEGQDRLCHGDAGVDLPGPRLLGPG